MSSPAKIMTFDLAANTGYAVGAPGTKPTFGHAKFKSTGDNLGRHQANIRTRLTQIITVERPDLIGFEQPSLFLKTTPRTMRKLCSYGNVLEEICEPDALNIPVVEINPSSVGKFWNDRGLKGREKKDETVRRAKLFGFPVEDDDEADAIACWFFMVELYGEEEHKQLFRQMRYEAGFGIQQKAAF